MIDHIEAMGFAVAINTRDWNWKGRDFSILRCRQKQYIASTSYLPDSCHGQVVSTIDADVLLVDGLSI
jgi:hypothetical protein